MKIIIAGSGEVGFHLAKLLGKGERAFRGPDRLAFTSRHSKKLYENGVRVFQELLSLGK